MIFIIFLAVILILAFFIAPMMIATNMVTLKKMQKVLDNYNERFMLAQNEQEKTAYHNIAKKELIQLKNKISPMDRKSFEHAKDLVNSI